MWKTLEKIGGRNKGARIRTDKECIELWLHGAIPTTEGAYRRDVKVFLDTVKKPLKAVGVADVQKYQDDLKCAESSKARKLAALRSLFRFGETIGYLETNQMKVVKGKRGRKLLGDRYLEVDQVQAMLDAEQKPRNRLILEVLYLTGLRNAELCGLCWKNFEADGDKGARMNVCGKGGFERTVPVPEELWSKLKKLRNGQDENDPVFKSQKGSHLDTSQVMRIVKRAAERAGLKGISPHWLRHSHATHAIANGAPLHLVQQTLGHRYLSTTGLYLHRRPRESSTTYLNKSPKKPTVAKK